MAALETRIADYLGQRMAGVADVRVDELGRIHGGSSQETFRFRARWSEGGELCESRLILRRAPESGLVVAERDLAFTVYSARAGRSCTLLVELHAALEG